MGAIDIARRLAELGKIDDAQNAYTLAIHENNGKIPEIDLEAAVFLLYSGGNYKIAATVLVELHKKGFYQTEILKILYKTVLLPNFNKFRKQYERNLRWIKKYPYIFDKNFPEFDNLDTIFLFFDDSEFVPYSVINKQFGDIERIEHEVIDRYFFKDLDNPIFANEVYSQYQLEYLCDNVRASELVGRENHIYLHYEDFNKFCAYLQIIDFKPMLNDKKFVFLFNDEESMYPIDFKENYGIDYSQYEPSPYKPEEIKKLIFHAQLSTHNGGDFFNEIFDNHPNLLCFPSIILEDIKKYINNYSNIKENITYKFSFFNDKFIELPYNNHFKKIRNSSSLLLNNILLEIAKKYKTLDYSNRIVPAVFFQPHFYNIFYQILTNKEGNALLKSNQYDEIVNSSLFYNYKYIKTFVPMRRQTTSYGATVKFKEKSISSDPDIFNFGNSIGERVLNRSYLYDVEERVYKDSCLVRFEDGKLNPEATFRPLAEFLDIPYTDSMTYCSLFGEKDPESLEGNDLGFSPSAIYRTYNDYTNDTERLWIEYMMRDAYKAYGYDLKYWDGKEYTTDELKEMCEHFDKLFEACKEFGTEEEISDHIDDNKHISETIKPDLHFVNKNGQPLRMLPMIHPDKRYLINPIYH